MEVLSQNQFPDDQSEGVMFVKDIFVLKLVLHKPQLDSLIWGQSTGRTLLRSPQSSLNPDKAVTTNPAHKDGKIQTHTHIHTTAAVLEAVISSVFVVFPVLLIISGFFASLSDDETLYEEEE